MFKHDGLQTVYNFVTEEENNITYMALKEKEDSDWELDYVTNYYFLCDKLFSKVAEKQAQGLSCEDYQSQKVPPLDIQPGIFLPAH